MTFIRNTGLRCFAKSDGNNINWVLATRKDAEDAYKENKENKKPVKPNGPPKNKEPSPEQRSKKGEKAGSAKPNKTQKGVTDKKKSQTQVNREAKADLMKSQREQMMEVLKATKAVNYELISDCDSEKWKGLVSSSVLIRDPEATSNNICCQVCNKDNLWTEINRHPLMKGYARNVWLLQLNMALFIP